MEIISTVIRRTYGLKHYNNIVNWCCRRYQQRYFSMSASRLEKDIDDLKTNPYYEKYAEKIASLQQTSPEEFLSRVEQRNKEKSKKHEPAKERCV